MLPSLRSVIPRTLRTSTFQKRRHFSTTPANTMGYTKEILKDGSGESPKPGQTVTIEYTGWLLDEAAPDKKGKEFDSSVGRGDFQTKIGVGQVIKGWDEGVVTMKKGEKALLNIDSDFAYGSQGFSGLIPPHSTLLFQVELKDFK